MFEYLAWWAWFAFMILLFMSVEETIKLIRKRRRGKG